MSPAPRERLESLALDKNATAWAMLEVLRGIGSPVNVCRSIQVARTSMQQRIQVFELHGEVDAFNSVLERRTMTLANHHSFIVG